MKDFTVVFDLDGTMIDTAPDLIAATNYTLGLFGMEAVEEHVIEPAVGLGSKSMLHTAMLSLGREVEKEELSRMSEHFIDYYADHIAVRSKPFPGLKEALAGLQDRCARLAICTNKPGHLTDRLIAELELPGYFNAIAGADRFEMRKPDPGHLLGTIKLAGGDPARSVMIGDSQADAKAAHSANVPFIAVTFGYGEKPVEVMKPNAVIDHYDELIGVIEAL